MRVAAATDADICVVRSDGTDFKVLAGGPNLQEHVSWSPDARRLVYCEYLHGSRHVADSNVWAMNADGSGKKRLTKGAVRGVWPTWSPDGTQIAFSRVQMDPEGFELSVMNADGGGLRSVAGSPGAELDLPTWAPNGKIIYMRNGDLFAINPDGSGLQQLTKLGDVKDYALSADGKRVAVHQLNGDRVMAMPLQGGGTSVTLLEPAASFISDPYARPAWTADGKALAVASGDINTTVVLIGSRLYIVNADGSGLSAVPGIETAEAPAWRPE